MPSGKPDLRALVTGASSGIGAAFARALHARGERLILVARRRERLDALRAELGAPHALTLPLDLARPDAAEILHSFVRDQGCSVDLLVNNAGVGQTGRFAEQDADQIVGMIDLNARALVDLTRRFLPEMQERGSGRILNVVSMAAFQPVPFLAVYAATKAFVLSFTEALAWELQGSGIRVQALCPGNIPTEFQRVAGTDRVPFNVTPATSAETVVEYALNALGKGSVRLIPSMADRWRTRMQRFVPGHVVKAAAAHLFRPPDGPTKRR